MKAATPIALALVAFLLVGCASAEPPMGACAGQRPSTPAQVVSAIEPQVATAASVWTAEPGESTFSSPQVVDLNDDGVLDIVLGLGQDTLGERTSSVIAIDGTSGEQLWRSTGHEDLIGSATFADLGGDSTMDIVIGGRRGALIALDGALGSPLWEFDDQNGRWFNFYTPQVVGDVTGDGVVDLVASNGGLGFDEPAEGPGAHATEQRHLGYVFVIDGSDGSIISSSPVPDRGESYMSAPILDGAVLLGTGGETLPGALWRVSLDALMNERAITPGADGIQRLIDGGAKGMIAAPSLGDLTGDCVLDIVAVAFDGTVSAVDGATGVALWSQANPGFESYSSPTLGYFVGSDNTPDVFVSVARGVWPQYSESAYLLLDGATGTVVWSDTLGTFAPSGFVAVDIDGDGNDEIIFGVNHVSANSGETFMLDPSPLPSTPVEPHLLLTHGQTTFSSPWVGDLDGDGRLDLITVSSAYQSNGAAIVRRHTLGAEAPPSTSWPGYLGAARDGQLQSFGAS